jgi:hypothetical protein
MLITLYILFYKQYRRLRRRGALRDVRLARLQLEFAFQLIRRRRKGSLRRSKRLDPSDPYEDRVRSINRSLCS